MLKINNKDTKKTSLADFTHCFDSTIVKFS